MFQECGGIERVTVLMSKAGQASKGAAYIQFKTKEGAASAVMFDGHQLSSGQTIKVINFFFLFIKIKKLETKKKHQKVAMKRTNFPKWMLNSSRGGGGGGGGRGRGRGRGRGGGHPNAGYGYYPTYPQIYNNYGYYPVRGRGHNPRQRGGGRGFYYAPF